MDCSWLGDDRIDCGNDEQNWDPNGTLRSLKSPDLLSWDSDQTITLRTTSFFFMFFCLHFKSFVFESIRKAQVQVTCFHEKKPAADEVWNVNAWHWEEKPMTDFSEILRDLDVAFWFARVFPFLVQRCFNQRCFNHLDGLCIKLQPLKHFPWLPKIPGIKWLSRELSGLSVQILLGKLRVSVFRGGFCGGLELDDDMNMNPMIPSGQKSSMNLGWVSDTPGDFLGWRGCIGNVPARENLQVYSLVIIIIVFFPKTCSKKIEGWISWNGGYMDKTRWEVANNIANHPPKWGYHQVLSLTFSRLRGVFSAKMVETWKFTTTEVWADLTKPSRKFGKIAILSQKLRRNLHFYVFFK